MKKYYWQRISRDGTLAEGSFTMPRRVFGRIFLGEKFTIIGDLK